MRIQCSWWLAFEVNKTISLSLYMTLCQTAAAKSVLYAPGVLTLPSRSFHFTLQILLTGHYKPQMGVQLGKGEEFAGLIDAAT